MDQSIFRTVFMDTPAPLAIFIVVLGDDGLPADYTLEEANTEFGEYLSREPESLRGESIRTIFMLNKGDDTAWMSFFLDAYLRRSTGRCIARLLYSIERGEWLNLSAFFTQEGHLTVSLANRRERRGDFPVSGNEKSENIAFSNRNMCIIVDNAFIIRAIPIFHISSLKEPADSFIGKPIWEFHEEFRDPRFLAAFGTAAENGRVELELDVLFPGNEVRTYLSNIFAHSPGAREPGYTVFMTDISAYKKTRKESGDLEKAALSFIGTSSDFNRFKRELETSRANFKAFFDTSMDLLMVLDEGGNIIAVNRRTCERLGYEEAELIGKSVLEAHPPELRGQAMSIVGAMLAGTAEKCPIPLIAKDGRRIPVETRIVHGIWDGKPALFGITRDMTELVESEEKFRKAFNSTDTVMAISRIEDGRFVEVNDAFVGKFGYARDEIIGASSESLGLAPGGPEGRREVLQRLDSGADYWTGERIVHGRDGQSIIGKFRAQKIEVNSRKFIFSSMADITERRNFENRLQRMVEFENLLVEYTSTLFRSPSESLDAEILAVLGKIGLLCQVDRSFIFRYSDDGTKVAETHEWCAAGVESNRDRLQNVSVSSIHSTISALARGEEVMIRLPEGLDSVQASERWSKELGGVSALLVPLRTSAKDFGFIGFDSASAQVEWEGDSTRRLLRVLADNLAVVWERREKAEELERAIAMAKAMAMRAEEVNRSKSLFFAKMSHEIRTPMNGMLGMMHFLAKTPLDEKQKHFMDILKASGDILLRIVNDILDVSKIEAGKLHVDSARFSVESVVYRALEQHALSATEKGIELGSSIAAGMPAFVEGDPLRLAQVLSNLIGNAVKFTPKGKISLSVGWAKCENRNGRDCVNIRFDIEDTGIGMNVEQLSRLFVAFGQDDASTARRYGGTGLGLVIVKNLCDIMGGSISVESRSGIGSRFMVILPFPVLPATVDAHPSRDAGIGMVASTVPEEAAEDGPVAMAESCASRKELSALLEALRVPVFYGEPKPSVAALAAILERDWPERTRSRLEAIGRCLRSYNFSDALGKLDELAADQSAITEACE
jgi:PAS domain S-box-containing protein